MSLKSSHHSSKLLPDCVTNSVTWLLFLLVDGSIAGVSIGKFPLEGAQLLQQFAVFVQLANLVPEKLEAPVEEL